MLNLDFTKRPNSIVRDIYLMVARKYGFTKTRKLKNYKAQNVVSNERIRIKSDATLLTENRIENTKPNLLIHDLRTHIHSMYTGLFS